MRFELSFQVSQDHVDKFVLNHVLVMQLMSTLLVMFCRGLWAQVCFKACIQPLLFIISEVRKVRAQIEKLIMVIYTSSF